MSFATLWPRIEDRVASVLDQQADALAGDLGGEAQGTGDSRRIALSAGAEAREFGTAAQGARPRLSDALAELDLAGALASALKEVIADDT